jgi:hypothetical protein
MKIPEGGSYDPETITLLRTVLDAAWDALLPEHQARTSKAHLAQRMLKLAAQGERDPIRLRTRALMKSFHTDRVPPCLREMPAL